MECVKCSAKLPANAGFCPECGAEVEHGGSNVCTECGESLKPEAKFCHACGAAVESSSIQVTRESKKEAKEFRVGTAKRNLLTTFAPILFIPICAVVIVLLFWKNKQSEPVKTSNSAATDQMAAMEQVHKTLERLKANIQANPEDLGSIDSLAQMHYLAGSFEKAIEYLEMHLGIEPDNKDTQLFLAMTYSNLNKTEEAITLINEILNKEPTYAFGLYNLGLIFASQGNEKEALKNWKKLVQLHPGTEMAKLAQQRIHELEYVDQDNQN